MDKIRTGLAAYGMSGRVFHAPFISTNPHFELTAVTERSKEPVSYTHLTLPTKA